jgi:hypothetical protein
LLIEKTFALTIDVPHVFDHRVSRSKAGTVFFTPSKKVVVRGWNASHPNDLEGRGLEGAVLMLSSVADFILPLVSGFFR